VEIILLFRSVVIPSRCYLSYNNRTMQFRTLSMLFHSFYLDRKKIIASLIYMLTNNFYPSARKKRGPRCKHIFWLRLKTLAFVLPSSLCHLPASIKKNRR
jgi:hypothetical protein